MLSCTMFACAALPCKFAHWLSTYLTAVLSEVEDSTENGFHVQVNDKLGGLLQTSFIVSYMLLSPLFGYLGDRLTRKYIIGIGILFWSAFTLIGSFSVVSVGEGRGGEGIALELQLHSSTHHLPVLTHTIMQYRTSFR